RNRAGQPAHLRPRPRARPRRREPDLLVPLGLRPPPDRRPLPPRMLDPAHLDRRALSRSAPRNGRYVELVSPPPASGEDGGEPPGLQPRPVRPRLRRRLGRGGIPRLRLPVP